MPPFSNRTLGLITLAGGLTAMLWTDSLAEPPQGESPVQSSRILELPELPPLPEPLAPEPATPEEQAFEERALRAFLDAAEGNFAPGGTGNGIVDDMLGVMQQIGPISSRLPSDALLDAPMSSSRADLVDDDASRRARTAEQLLKAARLLEQLGDKESEQVALIRQMRAEAKRLLAE